MVAYILRLYASTIPRERRSNCTTQRRKDQQQKECIKDDDDDEGKCASDVAIYSNCRPRDYLSEVYHLALLHYIENFNIDLVVNAKDNETIAIFKMFKSFK